MEQHDGPVDSSPAPAASAAPAGSKMRLIAVGATAIALLGISIPFVWQPHAESATPATLVADVTPAASHARYLRASPPQTSQRPIG